MTYETMVEYHTVEQLKYTMSDMGYDVRLFKNDEEFLLYIKGMRFHQDWNKLNKLIWKHHH